MRAFISLSFALLFGVFSLVAQVPTPRSTVDDMSTPLSWKKQGALNFVLVSEKGKTLNNVIDLYYLKTDTLAVLDKTHRKIYLLNAFKDVAVGSGGSATILSENIKKSFYITNPHSFAHFVDDEYTKGVYANIQGSYVYYLESEDRTYLLKDIRKFDNWGAGSSVALESAPNHTYWYKDGAEGKFGVIEKGETLDYSRVTSEKSGNDLIVKWDGVKTYTLQGYYTVASFVFKPVKMYTGSGVTTTTNSASTACVRGNCDSGWGKYEYSDGGYYEGFWTNGKKNGYGLYKWEDGGKYIGNWTNDAMSNWGIFLAANGDNIKGQYGNGQLNGLGVTLTSDEYEQGIFSQGSLVTSYDFYSNDVETGCTAGDCTNKYGRYKYENGDNFTGFFKNGNFHMGTYVFADGGKYTGMFNGNNQFHGTGRYFFPDKSYYGGQWKNGQYNGLGYYSDEDGTRQIGAWANGSLIRSMQ